MKKVARMHDTAYNTPDTVTFYEDNFMSWAMRTLLMLFCLAFSSLLLTSTNSIAAPSSDGIYTITTDLIGSSGGSIVDSSYQLQASIGQPAQGQISDAVHTILAGFFTRGQPIAKPKSNIFLLIIPTITSQAGQ